MENSVNMILEEIKTSPTVYSSGKSIAILSNKSIELAPNEFDIAVQYIWKNDLVKILKVEREHQYITKLYADVSK